MLSQRTVVAIRQVYKLQSRLPIVLMITCGILVLACSGRRDPHTVVVLIESAPLNLDPRIGTDAQSARISELIFDSLLRRDEHSQLQPSAAASWETPDPLTYILHLRSDIKFHDGRLLRAQDVKFTLDSLISGKLKSLKSGSFTRISSVDAPDAQTIVIHLTEQYASFLWNLTQGAFGIVPEGSGLNVNDTPIGSGPFRFSSATAEQSVVLERNEEYWNGAPNIQRIEFKVVPDATTRALELRKGTGDIVVNGLPADTVESLRREPDLVISEQPGNTYQYLGLNLTSPKLTLPVRKALAYGIDRQGLIRYLLRGQVRLADSVLPAQHWAHADGLPEYRYNPVKAIQLLEAANLHPDSKGIRLELEMKTSTDQGGRELSAVLQEQLRHIGIRLVTRAYEFATFYADITKGNFDLFSLRWIGGNEDPDIFEYIFHSLKSPPVGANRGRFNNPEADALIEQARQITDIPSRRKIYGQLQILLNEQLPYIHLWYVDAVAAYNRRLKDVQLSADGSYYFLTKTAVN